MRKSLYLSLSLLFAAVLLAYGGALANGYVWDDQFFLSANMVIDDLPKVLDIALQPLFGQRSYFRPIPMLMIYAEAVASGRDATLSHAINLLIHYLNAALVLVLVRRAMADMAIEGRARWLAPLLLALIYAVHPALTEVVLWVSSRFDLMATLWMLLALWVWGEDRLSDLARAVLAALLFFLGALCKESVVVLPVVLVVYRILRETARSGRAQFTLAGVFARRELLAYAAIILMGLVYLVLRHQALAGAEILPAAYFSPAQRGVLLLLSLAKYAQLTLVPFFGISVQHSFYWPGFDGLSAYFPSLLFSLVLLGAVAYGLVRRRPLALATAMWVVGLLPVLHVLPLTIGDNLVHERFLYFPVALLLLLLPYALARLQGSQALRRLGAVAAIAVVVLSILLVRSVVPMWKDNLTLWEWAVRTDPGSREAGENLLGAYAERGMYPQALEQYEVARKQGRRLSAAAEMNVGVVHYYQGDYRKALEAYNSVLHRRSKLPPQYRANLYASIALQHALLGNDLDARGFIGMALNEQASTNNAVSNYLAFCHGKAGPRWSFSEAQYRQALSPMRYVTRLLEKNQAEKYEAGEFCPDVMGLPVPAQH
jgi:hypothetical protein